MKLIAEVPNGEILAATIANLLQEAVGMLVAS